MSQPSSGAPREIVDAQVEDEPQEQEERVELDLDEEKLEAWDKVKDDYAVVPAADRGDASGDGDPDEAGGADGTDAGPD